MTPAEAYDDHRRRPRSVGKLAGADLVGDVGSIVVGDALRFYLKTADSVVQEARFQVFNAGEQVAASSVLTEVVRGRTLDQALLLGPVDLCDHLGGLDPALLPPRIWALDALRTAIRTARDEDTPGDIDTDPLLCRCHGIHEATVRQSIQVMDLADADAVVAATGAGTGCGSCRADIPRLLAEAKAPAPQTPSAAPEGKSVKGRIPTLHAIARIQSRLAAHWSGGTLELWDLDGKHVKVRAGGTFLDDQSALRAAAGELESALRAEVDPGLGVIIS